MPSTIVAVDLFCGVGGLTHGLSSGGIRVVAGIDIDPDCEYPFVANNAAEFQRRDIRALSSTDLRGHLVPGAISLLAGCAPCQPFSTYSRSGRSKKYELEWPLVSRFGELIRDVQPDLVTMENVPQLLDHPVFEKFLCALDGYFVKWSVVDCSRVGVPQTRRRLVLLASRFGPDGLDIEAKETSMVTVRDVIGGLPALEAGAADAKDPLHVASRLSETNLQRIRASTPGGTWREWDSSLRAGCHLKHTGATYPSVYGRMEWDKPAPTITTQCFGFGNGRFGHPQQDRAISLREAAMLQTFPRDYKFVPDGARVRFSKMGRLIGNAVPVRLGEVIAETLVRHVGRYPERVAMGGST